MSPAGGTHTMRKVSHQLSPSRSGQMDPSPGWGFLFCFVFTSTIILFFFLD